MFRVVFLLIVAFVVNSLAGFSGHKSCKNLPKLPVPPTRFVVTASPFVQYISTPTFKCSNTVLSYAGGFGGGDNVGTALSIRGPAVIVFDYKVDADNLTIHATICGLGIYQKWHLGIFNNKKHGVDYCLYSCKGDELLEYTCGSNHGTTKAMVKAATDFAKGIPGWERIGYAQAKCPKIKGCKFL